MHTNGARTGGAAAILERPVIDKTLTHLGLDPQPPPRGRSPTGHSAGFMIYNSYYRLPNQRSFIPYNPNANPNKQLR